MIAAQMINDAKVLAGLRKRKTGSKLNQALKKATTVCAVKVHAGAVRKIMSGPKTGHIYNTSSVKISKSGKRSISRHSGHQASAPGEPPANDFGNLARSGKVINAAPTANGFIAKVEFSAEYAGMLEHGTRTIDPRPFLEPTLNEMKDELNQIIMDAVTDANDGGE